jgi:hypothetical protein
MDTELFEAQLNKVERHLAVLTAARISSEVDTGHVARLASCVEVLVGSKSAALDSNEVLASKVLKTIEVIAQEVDKAESEGKPVDASLVRRDLHKIASQVSTIVAGDLEGSLNQLSALETEVNTIQGYFVDSV